MGSKVTEEVKTKQSVKELVEKDYTVAVLESTLPVVLDFYSPDSAACTALAPRFGAVAEKFEGKIQFIKILRQNNPGLSEKLGVTTSPTLVFFKQGQESGQRLTGNDIKRTDLKAQVEALLK
ncbi:thioredoxin family protein [Hyalangium sp.]|uniref:thioredoxin family protein n=1 Tax=Hyalangium sp. TaxID=2028555 RepID=UPI002D455F0E|nr:thioredoxin family protein [Hyalangium sp.]HYH94582.1 thioredoxin family protein [Hyalangium sp.]